LSYSFTICVIVTILAAGCTQANFNAVTVLVSDGDNTVNGTINFEQNGSDAPVRVRGVIQGLSPGQHGFHVHELGDLTQGCKTVGAHYNPFRKTHGGPYSRERHVGDLGNVLADATGRAKVDIWDRIIRLNGPYTVIGRSLAVHANVDDLGLGGAEQSNTTGNSGPRLACGTIGLAS